MLTLQGLLSFINSAMLALSHLLVVALWYASLFTIFYATWKLEQLFQSLILANCEIGAST